MPPSTRSRRWSCVPALAVAFVLFMLPMATTAAPNLAVFRACITSYAKTSKSRMILTFSNGNTPLYQQLSQRTFNTRFWWQRPAVIGQPASNRDVSALMRCGNKAALRYAARCGGHNYEGLSSINNGLVIDLNKMSKITVNKRAKIATIGAGQRLGPVYRALYENGGFMIPGGTCVAVGVSGLTSGGGIGASTRKLGLTIDWLLSATVVTSAGAILSASATTNTDLFFAIRGGGGNYGIVTSWTFRLAPVPPVVTVLEASWSSSVAESVLRAFGNWKPWSLPEDYSNIEWFWGAYGISTSIYYWGEQKDVQPLLQTGPFKLVPGYSLKYFQQLSYADYLLHYTNFLKEQDWTFQRVFTLEALVARQWGPKAVVGAAANPFKAASVMLNKDLTDKGIHALAKAKALSTKGWVQARALRGAAARVANDATAYPHRKAVWELQVYSDVSSDADVQWVRKTKAALRPYSTGYEYVNYIDCGGTKDPWRTYFAGNAARLKAIKKKFDPANRLDALNCH